MLKPANVSTAYFIFVKNEESQQANPVVMRLKEMTDFNRAMFCPKFQVQHVIVNAEDTQHNLFQSNFTESARASESMFYFILIYLLFIFYIRCHPEYISSSEYGFAQSSSASNQKTYRLY